MINNREAIAAAYVWWDAMIPDPIRKRPGNRGALARLRRCASVADAMQQPETIDLFRRCRPTQEEDLVGVALAAAVLAHVRKSDLYAVWQALEAADLATPNLDLVTDIIACPGMDYCTLANARSIPIAQKIAAKFENDIAEQRDIGELKIKVSGCINGCGHHHAGHIGILGVEKKGTELYQITVGGDATEQAAIGDILGHGFIAEDVPAAIERLVDAYIARRQSPSEPFIDAFRRIGKEPFKEALYGNA